jgi:hypothetical protein
MSSAPTQADVLAQYREGVDAVVTIVAGWDDAQWAESACGVWSGTDLAGHLVTVIGWYHSWLDRGLAGDRDPVFPIAALDTETVAALAALPAGSGPARIDEFRASADAYAARLGEHWDAPFAYPRGLVTAGLHAGVAAVEWHVHAWDLAWAAGGDHEPPDAEGLFLAAARCQLAVAGGLCGRAGMQAARLAARRRPWHQLLQRMGRD